MIERIWSVKLYAIMQLNYLEHSRSLVLAESASALGHNRNPFSIHQPQLPRRRIDRHQQRPREMREAHDRLAWCEVW
jgi:hypothetical protein